MKWIFRLAVIAIVINMINISKNDNTSYRQKETPQSVGTYVYNDVEAEKNPIEQLVNPDLILNVLDESVDVLVMVVGYFDDVIEDIKDDKESQ